MRADIIVDRYDMQVRKYGPYNPAFAERARMRNAQRERIECFKQEQEKALAREAAEAALQAEIERTAMIRAAFREVPIASFTDCQSIIAFVADFHKIAPGDITGRLRAASIVEARYDAVALCKVHFPHFSLPHIGKRFSRDHTTMIHALRNRGWTGKNWRDGQPSLSDHRLWKAYRKAARG